MRCDEAQSLLHAYADDELDLTSSLQFEEHLRSCAQCATELAQLRQLRTRIQSADLYHRAPAAVQQRARQSLRTLATSDGDETKPRPRASTDPLTGFSLLTWRWQAIAVSLAVLALAGWALVSAVSRTSAETLLVQDVIGSHVRSLMADHLTDVASSDQHTVKPWFSGRLDFSPEVKDLAPDGFPLVGGRLDYLDQRPVAALVYKRRQHTINLFVWPNSAATDSALHESVQQGYHVVHWTKDGFNWWAVSDLNAEELRQFAELTRQK